MTSFEFPTPATINPAHLQQLAHVAVRVGLNLQPGQDLLLSAPLEALPLARLIITAAYKAGAGVVTTLYQDDAAVLIRHREAVDASFDRAADWLYTGMGHAYQHNTARLAIVGDNPLLLQHADAAKVARLAKATAIASKPAMTPLITNQSNWTLVSYPTRAWAAAMFPQDSIDTAQAKLAEAIFRISRITGTDPLADWQQHNAHLIARRSWLNDQRFDTLHFQGPGTDLHVGLANDHAWCGGHTELASGVGYNPNIPTEEVFTTPDSRRVEGIARSTKPLAHNGTLIDDINVRFEAGRIIEAHASQGEEAFRNLLATDDGASRLGEVALVPHSSPISQSGLLFYNTLYDENAACHIALGNCYSKCFTADFDHDAVVARGGNQSLVHVDWMIGSDAIDVDGLNGSTRVPVLRAGEWVNKL